MPRSKNKIYIDLIILNKKVQLSGRGILNTLD